MSGFFRKMAESEEDGPLFEAFTMACARIAFPSDEGWLVVPEYSPSHQHANIPDVLDLGIFKRHESTGSAEKALILEITHWKDETEPSTESNKVYKTCGTLEKFSHLGSRVRVSTSTVDGLPSDTAFGNIIYGNRGTAYNWICDQYELSLDYVKYPSYMDQKEGAFEAGITNALKQAREDFEEPNVKDCVSHRPVEYFESQIANDQGGIINDVAQNLIDSLNKYKHSGFPLSEVGDNEYTARFRYRDTDRYERNLEFLKKQINNNGGTAERFSVKSAYLDLRHGENSEVDVPDRWFPIMEYVVEKEGEEVPEIEQLEDLLDEANRFLQKVRSLCKNRDMEEMLELWDHDDDTKRKTYRNVFRALSNIRVDNFYELDAVSEHNFSSEKFDNETTEILINEIMEGITDIASNSDDWISTGKEAMMASLRYQSKVGTDLTPTDWALEAIIMNSSLALGEDVIEEVRWDSYTPDVPERMFEERVFSAESWREGRMTYYTPESDFSYETDSKTVHIKSKPVPGGKEDGRRAREEGHRAWTGTLQFDTQSGTLQSRFSDNEWWVWVDGEWDRENLERLVECGWRVYLDPFSLVEELESR
jgi:hypothetical protein